MVRRTAVSLGISVLLLLFLTPRYGLIAAAWAVVITHFVNLLLDVLFVATYSPLQRIVGTFFRPLLCATLSGVVLLAIRNLGFWPSLAFYIIIYVLLLFVLRVFSNNELLFVRQFFFEMRNRIVDG
jgi:hypothetical protein